MICFIILQAMCTVDTNIIEGISVYKSVVCLDLIQ